MTQHPKISPKSIITSTLFISLFGGIWYGVLFDELQREAHRYTPEDYENNNPTWYLGGLAISFFISWGIGLIIQLSGSSGVRSGIVAAIKAILGFGLPLISYPLVFSPLHDWTLYIVGLGNIAISWIGAGIIIGWFTRNTTRILGSQPLGNRQLVD